MPTKLTKAQRNELFDSLLAAFPSWDTLRLMARRQLDKNLAEVSAQSNPLSTVVLDLIIWAEAGGYLAELVDGALAQQPENAALKSFAATMAAASPPPAPAPLSAAAPPDAARRSCHIAKGRPAGAPAPPRRLDQAVAASQPLAHCGCGACCR